MKRSLGKVASVFYQNGRALMWGVVREIPRFIHGKNNGYYVGSVQVPLSAIRSVVDAPAGDHRLIFLDPRYKIPEALEV